MQKDKIKELLSTREASDPAPDNERSPVTVLFSDIKGSTAYFEKYGDVRGLAMVQRHNTLMFAVIEGAGGRVVKTIGDAIMAAFADSKSALQAAIGMQRVLEGDRIIQPSAEQIHIKVGLHAGNCIVKDEDVYGDVVNVASRVQNQAEPDQILITEDLLDAAFAIGAQCAQMGHENMRGRVEPIEVYAVAWSATSSDRLIEEVQTQFEKRLKEAKRQQDNAEQEFEAARDQWRGERRRFTSEIERLNDAVERAKESARGEISTDLHAAIRFQLEEAVRARQQSEQDLLAAQARWNIERDRLKAQIASMQNAAIDALEQANNPTRIAIAVREKLDQRLTAVKQEWELQWDGERQRLNAEIDRLKKSAGITDSPEKEERKRAILELLGKLPANSRPVKTAAQWENDFNAAKIQWNIEQQQLLLKLKNADRELAHSTSEIRSEALDQLRAQYEPQLASARADRQRLENEVASLTAELAAERQRTSLRIEALERAIAATKEATTRQVSAELRAEFEVQVEEFNRLKARTDRRYQNELEEWESERSRTRKLVSKLEDDLKEAKEAAHRSQRIKVEVASDS